MNGRPNLRLAGEEGELRFGPRGEVRESFAESGRVHMDRWLPFVVLHRSQSPDDSIARRVALNSPGYLVWSPCEDAEAASALDLLLSRLRGELGQVLLVELHDATIEPQPEHSPRLPTFDFSVAAAGSKSAQSALDALSKSLAGIIVDLRKPEVSIDESGEPLLAGSEGTDRLSVTIPPIHRAPDGGIYPQLAHELAAGLSDSLLCSAAAFMGAALPGSPPHFRSLGRSAFLTAALHADKKLDSLARSFDFLLSISPINSAEAKARFIDQGEQRAPEFRYRPLTVDPDSVKRDLYAIDLSILEDLLLEGLLCDKRREIDIQMTMLAARNSNAFKPASLLLYGTVDSQLLENAHAILSSVPRGRSGPRSVDAPSIAAEANKLIDHYRSVDSRFQAKVEVRDDVAGLLVSGDRLMISSDSAIPANRLDALLSHEVSVHLLTYFNGATQGLTIFRTGLAGYEGIQEGLGVFAEWAVGGLTPARLRLLAGRVVAVDAMIDGTSFVEVYRLLRDDFGFGRGSAFDISARVFRSGGLAKDAIYLKGFAEVMNRVAAGSSLEPFWLGKIAPDHVEAIEELLLRGLLHPPIFVPEFLNRASAQNRIDKIRGGLRFDRLLEPE
ncbi:MAG: flavohemoglobin expression-modulating QEGLA motif protein [Pseudomonadota bacterium]|nr:flavohemoglobin expression-modulating QEGLA motif protein [Sphingomonas sp.]MDQ3483671.1 flavohemoglobin expression-modulating QEGLA motif protein [Pseudomonadota bacterium]